MEELRLNTAIASFMIFIKKVRDDGFITKEELRQFLILLNPIAPHITSEIFERVFDSQILDQKWPDYDEKYLTEAVVQIAVQVNSKIVARVDVETNLSNDEIASKVQENESVKNALLGKNIVKTIVVPGRIVNFIVK